MSENSKEQLLVPPSYFSSLGIPCCSKWNKMEIEMLAWAYVTTMARIDNTWHPVTVEQCRQLLTKEELHEINYLLPHKVETWRFADWWEMVGEQLKDANGAFDVKGISWSRWNYEKHKTK